MEKICIACGMPMESAEDFAGGDTAKAYCVYCARPDGSMQSYEEKLEGYANWLVQTQGLAHAAAVAQAKTILAGLPAWRSIGS